MNNIAVIGSGICGLTTAYTLKEKGYNLTVFAHAFPPETTSNKAAAFWFPYHIVNDTRCIRWSQTSYKKYLSLLKGPTGISLQQLIKVTKASDPQANYWLDFMPEGTFRLLSRTELPKGYDEGYAIEVPLIETQLFLPWLLENLKSNGVAFRKHKIADLNELSSQYDWVINCTGLGARELCQDEQVYPIRGQVALLAPMQGIPIFLYEEQPFYIVPRQDATIVGGTFEEHVWELKPEPANIGRLHKQALALYPQLAQAPLTGSWAGLRPFRKVIRVERESGKNIIHNYGHGGSGFTLAWGSAEEVLATLQAESSTAS